MMMSSIIQDEGKGAEEEEFPVFISMNHLLQYHASHRTTAHHSALLYGDTQGHYTSLTYNELYEITNRIASYYKAEFNKILSSSGVYTSNKRLVIGLYSTSNTQYLLTQLSILSMPDKYIPF